MPATVQAAIEARIDRLTNPAKRTLNAAAVIGARFEADLLAALGIDAVFDELLGAELIDQVRFTPSAEYAFRHPLIRAVAYESQLKSDRAELHRRVAAAIESHDPAAADENAALIAEHLETAGDLHAAYQWHMRAATWATYRDVAATRQSWERAEAIADALPAEDPTRTAMRIAPRTMLCGIAWRVQVNVAGDRFEELRELCTAAGDKASLAIAMAGLVIDHGFRGRIREASRLASEAWALIESIGDPTLTVGLSFPVIYAKAHSGEWSDVLRWSQRAIDLAEGDPSLGNFIFGSPLALAFTTRALARYCLGRPGWPDDLRRGVTMARSADPLSYAMVVAYVYFPGIPLGALAAHDPAVREIEDVLPIVERSGDDMASLVFGRAIPGLALVHRHTDADRDHGQKLLEDASDVILRRGHSLSELRLINAYLAREMARRGDRDEAIPLMRAAVDELVREGQLLSWGIPATGVLVETLLERGTEGDVVEAEVAIERLAAAPADDGLAIRDIWLLRLRALLARSRGDDVAYRDLLGRYRAMAESLGFEGHIAWAKAMPVTAGVACGSCGTGLRESAKFCDECGAATATSADTAEYKQVTVLFADVVRSMDIAAAVDIERLREIMTELLERVAAVVRRYGGTVEYTGDGVMATFGAPVALEDHAFRGCLAALAIQEQASLLAAEVARRDGVALQLRVGLNSGRVIAGEIGSGTLRYAATGEHVGIAQRMESVAPAGGVLVSEATARLVEHAAVLAEPEWVHIKGADEPGARTPTVGIGPRNGLAGRAESEPGRSALGDGGPRRPCRPHDRWQRWCGECGGTTGHRQVPGGPGVRRTGSRSRSRGVLGHLRVPRQRHPFPGGGAAAAGVHAAWPTLTGEVARANVRQQIKDADPQDLLLLDDLLGIADADVPLPQIDPDARRRRLTALLKTALLARTEPALYIIEDAHWIDAVSESMIADLLTVIPRTPLMVSDHRPPRIRGSADAGAAAPRR